MPEARGGMPVLIYRIEYEGGGTVPPSPHPVRHPSCTPQSPELRDQSRTRTVSTPGVSSRDNPNPWGGDSHAVSRNHESWVYPNSNPVPI